MAYLTDFEYYSDTANNGSYQYVSLKDIVRNYMLMYVGEDQVVDNVPAYKVRFEAKSAIKELNYDAFKSTRIVEDVIQQDLKYIMPSDYVDLIRLSVLVNGKLLTLTENRSAMSADVYLRDNSNEILFDNAGEILIAGSSDLEQSRINDSTTSSVNCYTVGGRYGLDTANANGNPTFRINRRAGVIDFDSTMSGMTIVMEYISDGMEGGDDSLIVLNKFFETYVYARISYMLLDAKAGISDNVKTRARQKQRALYRNARIRISSMKATDLLMTLRGQNEWTKG